MWWFACVFEGRGPGFSLFCIHFVTSDVPYSRFPLISQMNGDHPRQGLGLCMVGLREHQGVAYSQKIRRVAGVEKDWGWDMVLC